MSHWRDHLESPLLGAYSLFDDATERFKQIDGLILRCADEIHILGASGKKKCLVAYTSLDAKKPMKINVTIANVLAVAAKSQNPSKWVDIPVTFFVDERVNSKDGIVAALRVKGRTVQAIDYTDKIAQIKACSTMADLAIVWKAIGCTALQTIKDEKKNELLKD